MNGLAGRAGLDTSTLIEMAYATPIGELVKRSLEEETLRAWCTPVTISETLYILCRVLGYDKARIKIGNLLESRYITLYVSEELFLHAAKIKCERAISLADSFTLALAEKLDAAAIFARREEELIKEMKRKPFDITIYFLEDAV